MQIEYEIFKDLNLLILRFSGNWSLDQYKYSVNNVIHDKDFESVQKVLSDFRELNLDDAITQIKELVEIREKTIKKNYIHVRIVNGSTIDYALKLLNINISIDEIENLLDNLKYKLYSE